MVQPCSWPERSVGRLQGWRQDGFRSRRSIIQRRVWPDGIIMATPALDKDLRLVERGEDLSVEEFGLMA